MSLRKLGLVVHVTTSVGWFGSVVTFLAIAIVGLAGDDGLRTRGAYVAMDVVARFVILPACLLAFASGVVQSLGTPWGLFRHYWVVIKLVLTVGASAFLILHMTVVATAADLAASGELGGHGAIRVQLVLDAALAVVVLLVATVLAVYKPKGVTRFGQSSSTGVPGVSERR
jgi:hypothetical protein